MTHTFSRHDGRPDMQTRMYVGTTQDQEKRNPDYTFRKNVGRG